MNVPLHYGDRFRLGNSRCRYFVSRADHYALELLEEIRADMPHAADRVWLLKHRNRIRKIVNTRSRAALTYLALTSRDPGVRRLSIWLRGLCGGNLGASLLYALAWKSDVETHLLVGRAMRHMGAWAQLRELAKRPDLPAMQIRIFRERPARQYASRLHQFVEHIPARRYSPELAKRKLVVAQGVRVGAGKPAKSRWEIRRVLLRIHQLVSGKI